MQAFGTTYILIHSFLAECQNTCDKPQLTCRHDFQWQETLDTAIRVKKILILCAIRRVQFPHFNTRQESVEFDPRPDKPISVQFGFFEADFLRFWDTAVPIFFYDCNYFNDGDIAIRTLKCCF